MGMTRSIEVQFNLSNPIEALTYARLNKSADRACRQGRNRQARYLLSIMVGARAFESLEQTGLEAVPDFPAQVTAYNALLCRAIAVVATKLARKGR